jgi:TPR repeat protein
MYANGKGVLKDDKQAASWYQKAAEQEARFKKYVIMS